MAESQRLYALIAEHLGVSESEVASEKTLDDLGADSLDVVELIMAIEEEHGIEIPDIDAQGLKTVGDVEQYLQRAVAAKT